MSSVRAATLGTLIREALGPEAAGHVRVTPAADPTVLRATVPASAVPYLAEWRVRLLGHARRMQLGIERVELQPLPGNRMIASAGTRR